MWPIVDHGFSTKIGAWKFYRRCDIYFRREQLSKFGDIKKEEGKELEDSNEGTLGEWERPMGRLPKWTSGRWCVFDLTEWSPSSFEATTQG